jgi:hypothetical protein
MTREAKRVAAALAAVNAFLEQERAQAASPVTVRTPAAAPSLWAVAGRIDQMSARATHAARRR